VCTRSRHGWIPGLARYTAVHTTVYTVVCTAVHVRKIMVRHLTLMKDYEGTAVLFGTGTAAHVRIILVMQASNPYEGL
jgi:hypothetical protein